jgi:hypothetical protein
MTRLAIKLAIVFSLQAMMGWFFYRCRAISHFRWASSDFIIFILPLLIGFGVAAAIVFLSFPRISLAKRTTAALGLSVVGAVISSYVGIFIGANLYGT